jgi:hypothetical protein
MTFFESFQSNICSPMILAFAFGIICRLIKSELSIPRDLYSSLSIYLLLALGLKGGVELSHVEWRELFFPAVVTILLGCITPVSSYLTLRHLGKFSIADAAGIAAHYGSVSAVTFIAAEKFVFASLGEQSVAPFMPTLLTLLEIPGIQIALSIGILSLAKTSAGNTNDSSGSPSSQSNRSIAAIWHELLTARSMVLLLGGMMIGFIIGYEGFASVKPFFDKGEWMFKGALTIFLLEMGLVAGSRLSDLKHSGAFLVAFGIAMPILHGALGVYLGSLSGLEVGSCTVLGTMAASASYIAAPPAVRMTLPEANPTYYLTAALAITFPFNLLLGIPIYFRIATAVAGQ